MLPSSINEILRHKADIINPGKPVVVGYEMPLQLAKSIARAKNSSIYVVYPANITNFTYDEYNSKIARKLLVVAGHNFPRINEEAYNVGLKARLLERGDYVQPQVLQNLQTKWNLTKLPYKVIIEGKADEYSIVYIYIYIYIE